MIRFLVALLLLAFGSAAHAQQSIPGQSSGGGGLVVGGAISGTCPNGDVLYSNNSTLGCETVSGTGTVTSVALSGPGGIFSVSGSPITTNGTLDLTVSCGTAESVVYFSTTSVASCNQEVLINGSAILVGSSGTGGTLTLGNPTSGATQLETSGADGGAGVSNILVLPGTSGTLYSAYYPNAGVTNGNCMQAEGATGELETGAGPCVTASGSSVAVGTMSTTGDDVYVSSSGNLSQIEPKDSYVFSVPSNVTLANGTTQIDSNFAWTGGTITSVDALTAAGSFTADIEIGGVGVTGCSAISVSSSSNTNTSCTAGNALSSGSAITLVISSATSSPDGAIVKINFSHTVN